MRDVIEPGRNLGHVDRDHARPAAASVSAGAAAEAQAGGSGGQTQQPQGGEGKVQTQQDKPSRAELEAAGPAGAGYPGSSEAAATQLAGGAAQDGAARKDKRECEDCD